MDNKWIANGLKIDSVRRFVIHLLSIGYQRGFSGWFEVYRMNLIFTTPTFSTSPNSC
jgi:hypothetical protein